MTAGIYARLSQYDGVSTSIDRQITEARQLAESKGLTVSEVYSDIDVSGFKDVVRPEYERMKADIRAGKIKDVVFFKLDRLTRRPRETEALLDLADEYGLTLYSAHDTIDMTSPGGRAMLRVSIAFASMESENISLRLKSQREEAAKAGLPAYGRRPFGYEKDGITINAPEAALVREAYSRVVAGQNITAIARDFKERGVVGTTVGKPLSVSQLKRILLRVRNIGIRDHKGNHYPAVWEPLIDDETFRAVEAILTKGKTKPISRSFLLFGLAYCGLCGHKLYGNYRENRKSYYRCLNTAHNAGCGKVSITAELADDVVSQLVETAIASFDAGAYASPNIKTQTLLVELADLETRLESVQEEHFVHGKLDQGTYIRLSSMLQEKISEIKTKLAEQRTSTALLDLDRPISEVWKEKSLIWKASFLQGLIERIDIQKGTPGAFKPERIQISWKR